MHEVARQRDAVGLLFEFLDVRFAERLFVVLDRAVRGAPPAPAVFELLLDRAIERATDRAVELHVAVFFLGRVLGRAPDLLPQHVAFLRVERANGLGFAHACGEIGARARSVGLANDVLDVRPGRIFELVGVLRELAGQGVGLFFGFEMPVAERREHRRVALGVGAVARRRGVQGRLLFATS